MLPFRNALTNEDPLAEVEMLLGLQHWYMGLVLVLGNLFGLPLAIYTYRVKYYFLSMAVVASIIISMLYHLCQTTQVCFLLALPQWVVMDHISAPALSALILLFVSNARSTTQILRQNKEAIRASQQKQQEQQEATARTKQQPVAMTRTRDGLLLPMRSQVRMLGSRLKERPLAQAEQSPRRTSAQQQEESDSEWNSEDEEFQTEETKSYFDADEYGQENFIYDAWSSATAFFVVLMAACAAVVHPFSMEAFIIVIVFALLLIFIKICVIDEGFPENMIARVALPELIVGVIFILVALVVFVLDSYYIYWLLHTLWHVLVYLGMYFFVIGLTANTPYWYSIWRPSGCCCSSREESDYAQTKKTEKEEVPYEKSEPMIKHAHPVRRRMLNGRFK